MAIDQSMYYGTTDYSAPQAPPKVNSSNWGVSNMNNLPVQQQPQAAAPAPGIQSPAQMPASNAPAPGKPWWESGYGLSYGQDAGADSPWLQSQLKQNQLGMQGAYDRMAQGSASQLGTGVSSLARSGGLNSGARERMAGQSAYNNMMGNQGIGMKGAQMAQGLRGQDYLSRVERGKYEDKQMMADQYAQSLTDPSVNQSPSDKFGNAVLDPLNTSKDFVGGAWNDMKSGNVGDVYRKGVSAYMGGPVAAGALEKTGIFG